MKDKVYNALLADKLADIKEPCPSCGRNTLFLTMRLVASKLGDHSLSGNQLKLAAKQRYWAVCSNCRHDECAEID